MHDSRLEDRLRSILRTEGDRLPLTVTSAELERRLVLRGRRATGRWISLVAAAVAVLAVGAIVAFGDGWFQPSVGTVASPSPSGQAVATPDETVASPLAVPGLGPIAPTPGGTVVMEFDPTLSDGTRGTFHTGLDSTAYVVTVKLACFGTGVVEFTTPSGSISSDCPPANAAAGSAENPWLFRFPISNQVWEGSVTVSAGMAFRWLAEVPPLPAQLPHLPVPEGIVGVDAASPSDRPIPGREGTRVTRTVGELPSSDTQRFALVCLGPGTVTTAMGPPGQPDPATTSDFTCDGEPGYDTWSLGTPGPLEVTITADPRIAWHVIATTEGALADFVPPALGATSWLLGKATGADPVLGTTGCDLTYDLSDGRHLGPRPCSTQGNPDFTGVAPIDVRAGGELRLTLDPPWQLVRRAITSAPMAAPGQSTSLTFTIDDGGTLRLPVILPAGSYILSVACDAVDGTSTLTAVYRFPLTVAP